MQQGQLQPEHSATPGMLGSYEGGTDNWRAAGEHFFTFDYDASLVGYELVRGEGERVCLCVCVSERLSELMLFYFTLYYQHTHCNTLQHNTSRHYTTQHNTT